jgi:hypothetical protein
MPASVRAPLPLTKAPAETNLDAPAVSDAHPFIPNLAPLRTLDHRSPRRGFPPDTVPLASHPTWGSFGANGTATIGEWRSAPLTATLGGWLKFETAGHLGLPAKASAKPGGAGVALELRDPKSDALLAAIRPSKVPGDTWRAAYVRAPRGPFVVVARDSSAEHWLAFSAPVEMSGPSHLAWLAVKNGRLLTYVAAALCAALGLVLFYQHVLFPPLAPRR